MATASDDRGRFRVGLAAGLAVLLAVAATAPTAEPLNLAACLKIALQQQPAVAAQRASLAAAVAAVHALDDVPFPRCLAHDLPYRRQQAALEAASAQARLAQYEQQTIYNVTLAYLTVLYTRLQRASLEEAVVDLKNLQTDLRNSEDKGVTPLEIKVIVVFIDAVEARRLEAVIGEERALEAMREAMGVGPAFCLRLAGNRLPELNVPVCREQILTLALARRGELAQAVNGADAVALEESAQAATCRKKASTFASRVDIHAEGVSPGSSNGVYRPAGVGIAMPPALVGSRCARVEQAVDLSARADAAADKQKKMIVLEVEDAYQRWWAAADRLVLLRQAAKQAEQLARDRRADLETLGADKVAVQDVITAELNKSQLQAQVTEVHYQLLVSLALLERVTAGGFCTGLAAALSE